MVPWQLTKISLSLISIGYIFQNVKSLTKLIETTYLTLIQKSWKEEKAKREPMNQKPSHWPWGHMRPVSMSVLEGV